MSLKELVDLNCRIVSSVALSGGDLKYAKRNIPDKLKKKINWCKLTKLELVEIGFREWSDGVYLSPQYLWNLIPKGTELFSVKEQKIVTKNGKEDIADCIMGLTQFGFKK